MRTGDEQAPDTPGAVPSEARSGGEAEEQEQSLMPAERAEPDAPEWFPERLKTTVYRAGLGLQKLSAREAPRGSQ